MLYVAPQPGFVVRDPGTYRELPPEGAFVENNKFWRRRLRDGDVTETKPPAPEVVKKSVKKGDDE